MSASQHPPLSDITNLHNIMDHVPLKGHTPLTSDDSGCDLMDDSLTDMQWLQRMDAGADFPGLSKAQLRKRGRGGGGRTKDGCRKKLEYSSKKDPNKPPLSYASLIALAICSTPQRMLTLNSIYRWIESTFPFYRTPEAKAWKNSIRHNLSIRKNMFMKVYQYPPRRGNGSYWSLLADGEEELKRAVPLFSTLHPPIIDENSVYSRVPTTHIVKSKGQFVPVLPSSKLSLSSSSSSSQDYFHVETLSSSSAARTEPFFQSSSARSLSKFRRGSTPKHLLDHSYARHLPVVAEEEVEYGEFSDGSDHESSYEAPSTPKRKKLSSISVHWPLHEQKSHPIQPTTPSTTTTPQSLSPQRASATPNPKEKDSSLNLLDSSFLTPVKNLIPDVEIDALSLSPLYNFVTPKRGNTPTSFTPGGFTPLRQPVASGIDSGVFSPLRMDCIRFSTPVGNLSPLTDLLPPNTFDTPRQDILSSLKIFDTSSSFASTLFRPGSLQALGLPGLTPPSGGKR